MQQCGHIAGRSWVPAQPGLFAGSILPEEGKQARLQGRVEKFLGDSRCDILVGGLPTYKQP